MWYVRSESGAGVGASILALLIFRVAFCTFDFIESAQVISTENCSIYKVRFEEPSFVQSVK